MKSAVFLQARLESNRLPHKILLNLDGQSVIEQAMTRLNFVESDFHVIVTNNQSYEILSKIAHLHNWHCFQGPGKDVLARYTFAARHFAVETVVRATADNPLVSYCLANQLLALQNTEPVDYRAHIGIPLGAGVEVMRADALERAFAMSTEPYDREHVCPFLYNNPKLFRIRKIYAPSEFLGSDLRITLDNAEDYQYLVSLFRSYNLGEVQPISKLLQSMYALAV